MKTEFDKQIDELEHQIADLKNKAAELRRKRPKELVSNYSFQDCSGNVLSLSELFGEKKELILIHNMGRRCAYCTLWADGFTGLLPHLLSRAAFAVVSNDSPADQRAFAKERNWNFLMCSAQGTSFFKDMGFVDQDGFMPGVSTFQKEPDGRIYRTARAEFGPSDSYCAVWHFLDLLSDGSAGWEPKLSYSSQGTGDSAPINACA